MRRGLLVLFCLCPVLVDAVLPLPAGKNGVGLDISGGLTLNSGNSNQTVINGGYSFAYRQNGFTYQSKLDLFYGQSNNITEVNNGAWTHAILHSMGSVLKFSGSIGIEYDRVARIGSRTGIDFGILCSLSKTEKNKTDLTATLRGEYLYGLDDTKSRKSIRMTLGLTNERTISETASFKFGCQLTPNIADLVKDYRFELHSSLSLLMKRPVWLTVKLRERYTSSPQNNLIKKNDLTLVTALTLSF